MSRIYDMKLHSINVIPKKCRYYNPRIKTIKAYVQCLYELDGCACGGLLHILLDEDNIYDKDILYCLGECIKHPEKEESKIGQLICEEYLKLSLDQRKYLVSYLNGFEDGTCTVEMSCETCLDNMFNIARGV